MATERQRYPESRIVQKPATEWLLSRRCFKELYSDEDAKGGDLDSIGIIDGRLFLIEYKYEIRAGVAFKIPPRSGTLEAKFLRFLKRLYAGDRAPDTADALEHWDRRPPVTVVCASSYSDRGGVETTEMLERLSTELFVDWEVWRWTGEEICVEAAGIASAEGIISFQRLKVPVPRPTPHRPASSKVKIFALAEERGVSELLRVVLEIAQGAGFSRRYRVESIGLSERIPKTTKTSSVITIFVGSSSTDKGLHIGYFRERFNDGLPELVGAPTAGYLNSNAWVADAAEFTSLLSAMKLNFYE
jgi:hypothetical protein